jgi:hypothetical protein
MTTVPKHEPEVIKAGARRYRGDEDKVATTAVRKLMVDQSEIISRYDKADELEVMRAMAQGLPASVRRHVRSIFCDSKASACYTVTMAPWDPVLAEVIGWMLDLLALACDGGHNGIWVKGDTDGQQVIIDPHWRGDDG